MNKFLLRPPFFFQHSGGGGDSSENQDDDASTGDDQGKDKGRQQADVKTFTQEQVNKMMADARKQGRDSSLSQLLEKAGVKSAEELIAANAAFKKAEEDKLSEVDKAKKLADDAKAEADQYKNELRTVRFERDFDRTVLRLELEFQNEKAREVAFKLLDIESAGKGEKEMEEAVKGLLKDHAYLFTEAEAEEIDATKRGKPNPKALKKEIIDSKRRSGRYAGI